MKFKDLKIGDKFSVRDVHFIKISDKGLYSSRPLPDRPTNAICLNNHHRIVFGGNVDVQEL